MRLDLLIDREPAKEIIAQTLQGYLGLNFDWKGTVRWVSRPSSPDFMWANGKLNVIYPRFAERTEVRKLAAEFAFHTNPFRQLLQSLYVRYGTSPGIEALLADSVVDIDPWLEQLNSWCIIPGNHSIRIVELSNNTCHVLLKKGFNSAFLNSELMVREKFPYLPIPQLLEADAEAGWFREKQVSGLPLNRLADAGHRKEALSAAQAALVRLYEDTEETVDGNIWAEGTYTASLQEAGRLPEVYSATDVDRIKGCARRLMKSTVADVTREITTVQSHGDLQPANILVNVSGTKVASTYLIDWEYSARRSIYYDALVFATRSRFPVGLSARVESLIAKNRTSEWNWSISGEVQQEMPHWIVAIFLLEDLLVRLQEQQIPGLKKKSDGLTQFLFEVEQMAWQQQ